MSVCIMTLYSVFVLCVFFTPYVWRALYLEGHIYLEAYICLEGSSLVQGLDHPDTSIPAASKMATLIFRDQNYVSRDIHFVCDDDVVVFYLFLQKQNLGAKLHIYL